MQNAVQQGNSVQQPQPQVQPVRYAAPPVIPQPQVLTSPNPNYAGVNIQIFNPSVGVPGSSNSYNVNAPSYQTGGVGQAYPANYYTQPLAQQQAIAQATSTSTEKTENKDNKDNEKKTEKRKIVQLTDDYIRNVENYLNSQDKEVRLMGAKEVVARLQEDDSRKDDKALTALVNKMLQDPSPQLRIMALGMLDGRLITGDNYTVGVLKKMQTSQNGYGQDAMQAANILLKMSGQTVEKEFEVKDKPKKEETKQAA